MIVHLRKLNILNIRTNLIGPKSLNWTQIFCNLQLKNQNKNSNNNFASLNTKILTKVWNLEKYFHTRECANFSSKQAENKNNLNNKSNNEKDDGRDKKQTPDTGRTLPRLMNFHEIMWPSMLNSIKNWIMVQFIIRPYMDREFNIRDFCQGAKKAMQVVSAKLMNGEFAALNNMVTSEALTELKPVIQTLSVSQRRQLEVVESDIYLTFPYEVGIMFDETNEKVQKRWVEITMVFHVLRGLKELRESGEEIPWNMGTLPEYQDKMFVCNYRFIKEFTTGNESDWTINVVNHFKPIDLINES